MVSGRAKLAQLGWGPREQEMSLPLSYAGLLEARFCPCPPCTQRAAEGRLASSPAGGRAGARLTVDSELEVLRLLARWAEGHTLVPPLVPQVTAGDSQNLAVLLELDVRVPWKDRPARMVRRTVLVRPRGRRGPAARRRAHPWGRGRQRGAQSPRGAIGPSTH